MIRRRRENAPELGQAAEARARRHLERQGLRCRMQNFRARGGEIDLVMDHGEETVFVEVRQRSDARFGSALESVTPAKRARLVRAAHQYLQRYGDCACRFDVVAIDAAGHIEWVANAFDADG